MVFKKTVGAADVGKVKTIFSDDVLAAGMSKLCSVGLALLLLANHTLAASPTNSHGATNTGSPARFTLSLPDGWQTMASEQIAALVRSDLGGAGPRRAIHGYFPTNSSGLIPTPFVTVEETGFRRIPERYLDMLANEGLRSMAVFDHVRAEGVLEDDIEATSYDTNRHLLRVTLQRTDPAAGRLREINHVHYTEHGSVTITCAAKSDEFPIWTNTFAQILASFRLAPGEQYESRPATRDDPAVYAQSALKVRFAIMGIGIFAPLIAWFLKRRFCEVRSDEI